MAMVRNDSMALDDLKDISFRRSYDGRNSPLKWECQRMFSSEMQLTDLCESSSDHYSSDGCFDDEADLHSIIWTAGVLAGPGDSLTLYDTENHDNTQIISPCTDEAAHLLPLCLWNQDDNLDLALHIHSVPQTPIAIVPTLNTQESSEMKSTSPRAVHGGKSETFPLHLYIPSIYPDQFCSQASGGYLHQLHRISKRHGPLYVKREASRAIFQLRSS